MADQGHFLMDGWACNKPVGDGFRPEELRRWEHPRYGTFVSGLFDMYQTHGLPLSISMDICKERGLKLCPMQERASALASGWTEERFDRWWAEGESDSLYKGSAS